MPHPIYHLGPSCFLGLAFRKWLDLPVFVLANVVVDMEVLVIGLFGVGYPVHRYIHTLLLGAAAGAVWGLAAYPMRGLFAKGMGIIRLPYKTNLWKMLISGVLGIWVHVVGDAIWHWDVRIFWPGRTRPLYRMLTHRHQEVICVVLLVAAVAIYVPAVWSFVKKKKLAESNEN